MKCGQKKSAKGEEIVVILTLGPLGPGKPMLPGSPRAPAGPMGPGLPSMPGRPWNQSLFKRYSASTGSHDLELVMLLWDEAIDFWMHRTSCIKCRWIMNPFSFSKGSQYTHSQPISYLLSFQTLVTCFSFLCHVFRSPSLLSALHSSGLSNYNPLLCVPRWCMWLIFISDVFMYKQATEQTWREYNECPWKYNGKWTTLTTGPSLPGGPTFPGAPGKPYEANEDVFILTILCTHSNWYVHEVPINWNLTKALPPTFCLLPRVNH